MSHLRKWLVWSYKAAMQQFVAQLKAGETFSAEMALAWMKESNPQANLRSVSYFTRTVCHNNSVKSAMWIAQDRGATQDPPQLEQ